MSSPPDSRGSDTALDPALPQKKRARRRLVGAAALCLAAAIALPLLFDSEPRQRSDELKVDIPSRDTPLPPARSGDGGSSTVTPSTADSKPIEVPPPAAKADARPAEMKPPEPKLESRVEPKPPEAKAANKGNDKGNDRGADKAAKAGAETKRYVLQVGAFTSEKGASEQADKVKATGLKAFTETVNTAQGERIRVRVGPFPTREAAEQARGQLKLSGIDSALIAP